ncbi:MAG: hypothetical protein ILNGONEN_00206 [Syntrophorhabdaceae bacterium]|nr:hypothetical protein [Syntrophorhabdaceae bacterium]
MDKENAALLLGCQVDTSCNEILQAYNLQRAIIFAMYGTDDPIQKAKYDAALESLELAFRILCSEISSIPSPVHDPLPAPIKPVDDSKSRIIMKSPTKELNPKTKLTSFASFLIGIIFFVFLQSLFPGKIDQEPSNLRNSESKAHTRISADKMEHEVVINNVQVIQGKRGMSFRICVLATHYEGQLMHLRVFIYQERTEYVLGSLPEYRNSDGQLWIGIHFEPLSDLHEEIYPIFIPYKAFTSLKNGATWRLSCLILITSADGDALAKAWHDFTLTL